MTSHHDTVPAASRGIREMWDELPVLEAANHAQAPNRVAEILRVAIAAGRIPPGAKLPEVKLTEKLEVSRHTLRSAFQLLAAEGLVARLPNRGVFVHEPTAEDVREIYRVRRIIETGAVRAAVFDEESIASLSVIVQRAQHSLTEGDIAAMAQANQQFHQRLIAQAHSAMLDELMSKILARMRLIFASMHRRPDFHSSYVEGNVRLVELLAEGRRQEAENYLISYLNTAEHQLLSHIGARDPAGVNSV